LGNITDLKELSLTNLELTSTDMGLAMGLGIACGLLYCFLGYRLLRFILGLTGFLLAGAVAAALAAVVSEGHLAVSGIAFLVGGIAGMLAFAFLYRAGVFCLGMLGASLVAHVVMTQRAEQWPLWAIPGIGLAGGFLALVAERPIMTLVTALIGAALTVYGAAYFVLGPEVLDWLDHPAEAADMRWVLLGGWMLLTLLGALAQFSARAKKGEEKKEKG
jgi:hypothetical protein